VNHSIYSADRSTHLKIVVPGRFVAGLSRVAGFSISARNNFRTKDTLRRRAS